MSDALWMRPATEVVGLLRDGQVSPKELIDLSAERIDQTNQIVNSVVTTCYQQAREQADKMAAGQVPAGMLHGLPVVIKDLDEVAGVRTTYGSPIYKDYVPDFSSGAVAALQAQGAIVIAKTNTPEFGAGANTFNEVFGTTLSPWDNSKTCGGSSGGSAVALATGQAWLATGSDLGGSLRIPAAFCGVVGMRPGAGRVPRWPYSVPFDPQSVTGPMARTVADVGLMLDAMSVTDPRDPLSFGRADESFAQAGARAQQPARVAWSPDLGGTAPVDPRVLAVCNAAIERWGKAGVEITDDCPDFSRASETFQVTRAYLMAGLHQTHYEKNKAQLKPDLLGNIEQGQALTMAQLSRAEADRATLVAGMSDFFKTHDLFITPTVMVPPFDANERYITEVNGVKFTNYIDWVYHTFALTLTGCPSISVPCGLTEDGLPVGLQLVASHRNESALLSFAAAFEAQGNFAVNLPIDPASM